MTKKRQATIHLECSPEFRKLIKEAAARRGTTIKKTTIMLLDAWMKIKDIESSGILKVIKQEK